ncbi:hypothetical protein AK812_SmicGene12966 [Symbiodinium microadriaticum]|uniref:Uncharacterized protein n=1 Tax=Symbiodinium microadriaticum TaxID=2951 RepID=A0A1Q9E9A9_SYMMI|nr:hypothetical protein AK812_SmicGene12966 [Symbiodinium microadriaticum]
MDQALAELAVSPKKKPAAQVLKKPSAKVVAKPDPEAQQKKPENTEKPENTDKTLEEKAMDIVKEKQAAFPCWKDTDVPLETYCKNMASRIYGGIMFRLCKSNERSKVQALAREHHCKELHRLRSKYDSSRA